MEKQSHTIPMQFLDDFSIIANGKKSTAFGTVIINGFECAQWISNVSFNGEAAEKPTVTITGLLDRLDDERKKSWGLIKSE